MKGEAERVGEMKIRQERLKEAAVYKKNEKEKVLKLQMRARART